jgi:uncharacterized protein
MLSVVMPPEVNMWIVASTGLGAGLLGSMLGIGGGVIIVPVLTLALGIPIQYAIGTSLASIVINACTATSVYIRGHITNLKLGLLLACAMIPGAVAGGMLASKLSSPVLSIAFGILLLYVAYTMLPHRHHKLPPETNKATDKVEDMKPTPGWLDGSFLDPSMNLQIDYTVHRPVTGMVTGFFGGVISSLLGIGGGVINVPVLNRVMKLPIKATIATSSLLLCFTTMTGSIIYAFNGFILPFLIAPLIIGVFIGARIGATLAHRLPHKMLAIIFSVFLLLTAVSMILKSINII